MSVETVAATKDMLTLLHYESVEDAGREMMYLSARSKLAMYRDEEREFERKYGVMFDVFRDKVERKQNEEDFEEEDDLMAWRFAHEVANRLEREIAELEAC
jgi:hypothetical protein